MLMSVTGISSSNLFVSSNQTIQKQFYFAGAEQQPYRTSVQPAGAGSENISGAQQDFGQIQQAFQNQASQTQGHHHHHHGRGEGGGNAMSQLFNHLGQALQSGNLSNAQTAYNSLVQEFQKLGQGSGQAAELSASSASSTGVSVSA
jgi:hypothetical protein